MIPVVVLVSLVLGGLTTACAKRPALTETGAPPPAGMVVAPPPPSASQPLAPATPRGPESPALAPATPIPAPAVSAPAVAAPPAPPPRSALAEFAENRALADIHFDFDKSAIRPGDARILDVNAGWLTENPRAVVLIEGHCDDRGTNEYNLALGERRANATRAYLVSRGIAASRMLIVSYGEERPTCAQRTEACWAKNRRGHFLTKSE